MQTSDLLKKCNLFSDLSDTELDTLGLIAEFKSFEPGEILIAEGEKNFYLDLITLGSVQIFKQEKLSEAQKIGELSVNQVIGEFSFLQKSVAEATVKAAAPVEVLRIKIATLESHPFAHIHTKIQAKLATLLANRLSETNVKAAVALKGEIDALKARVALGYMLIAILFLAAGYEFALGLILAFKNYFPSTTPFSVAIIIGYATILFVAIRRSGYPLSAYGLTTKNAGKVAKEAVLISLPIMGVILLLKLILIYSVDAFRGLSLFDPMSELRGEGAKTLSSYFLIVSAYALFCPIQEFIGRGALQSSLQLFLGRESKKAIIVAVVLSNLVFASSHMHTTYLFALLSFVPGLFWGYLFNRQRSLVGVSVSHILIGVWVSFVVGFPFLTNN